MKNNIILTGFMGSGKTSVGIRLSYAMKRTMVDTDKWIEKRQGMTVSEIFDGRGEEAFREMETECLRELIKTCGNQIISVGGGLPVREENRRLLSKLGRVFYLKASLETIYERLKNDTTRPLLQTEDPLGRIKALLKAREDNYMDCADAVIEVSGRTFDEILEEIKENLK